MPLIIQQDKHVCTISFNIPRQKNPLTPALLEAFGLALDQATADPDCKVIVLTGEGGNFCSGASLDGMNADPRFQDVSTYLQTLVNPSILKIRSTPKPFIAKVEGVCVGLGMSIALACDMIYAEENARFSPIFTKIGLSGDGGISKFLLDKLGWQRSFEMMSLAQMLSAPEMEQLGLVNKALPSAENLNEQVGLMAQTLANGPGVAIGHTKLNLLAASQGDLAQTLLREAMHQGLNFQTSDFMEGVMAFMEKRKAVFQGK